jgi:hypothetical protein
MSNRGQLTRSGPPAFGLGEGLTTPRRKYAACDGMLHRALEFAVSSEHGNELSSYIKGGKCLDQKNSLPCS